MRPDITVPETQSPDKKPSRIRLSQRSSYSTSSESSDTRGLIRLQRSCTSYAPVSMDVNVTVSVDTVDTVEIPNAQPEKHQQIIPPHTESSQPETEDTYVEYCVTHVQGGGDNEQYPTSAAKPSTEGAYSLVAHSLRLSTV